MSQKWPGFDLTSQSHSGAPGLTIILTYLFRDLAVLEVLQLNAAVQAHVVGLYTYWCVSKTSLLIWRALDSMEGIVQHF